MRRLFRFALLFVAGIFLAAIVVAGLMLFGQPDGRELHTETGYILATAGVPFLILPALARAGRTTIVLGLVTLRALALVRSDRQGAPVK